MDKFARYSSKVKRVNIPIPGYDKFQGHSAIGAEPLIGRSRIIEKLKLWLGDNGKNGGAFLITGYRGMGKTSFVNKVLYELVGETNYCADFFGFVLCLVCGLGLCYWCSLIYSNILDTENRFTLLLGIKILIVFVIVIVSFVGIQGMRHKYVLKERLKKNRFKKTVTKRYEHWAEEKNGNVRSSMKKLIKDIKPKEWNRINYEIYGVDIRNKKYTNIGVNISLGQEILDERDILCVLMSQLHDKYRRYFFSPVANTYIWLHLTTVIPLLLYILIVFCNILDLPNMLYVLSTIILSCVMLAGIITFRQLRVMRNLSVLRKRIDAEMQIENGVKLKQDRHIFTTKKAYSYPIAGIRDIETQLIAILEQIERIPWHPTFYFIFDELDKIETPLKEVDEGIPAFSNEKYLPGGGASRKRKFTVMHLLANMKFFTSSAKAKFVFIAGREMYDAFLADLTDRESTISSLFNGVIYVESFCKNEKSDKDVIYNTETFIARQLIPHQFIEGKIYDKYIECKLSGNIYTNIDINLKMYYEYLMTTYSDKILVKSNCTESPKITEDSYYKFNDARSGINRVINLLNHFSAYLYHVSNGSPKKMKQSFENHVRPLRREEDFLLEEMDFDKDLFNNPDLDIYISCKSNYLLSFGEKEQRVIGFIHYISFPVNQIITDADQFGDKLLVSATFLINHLYKYHNGGFSWRNIEQTPELLEVYKIPEFRGFINSILNYLTQTHIIQIPCGLYQYKFRKQISEEISLASKISEEVSAIFNFTLDESQSVKQHYLDILKQHQQALHDEKIKSSNSLAGIHHILADLYMSDEEYNRAILEYQIALCNLQRGNEGRNLTEATFAMAYIRNMLKLGLAYEKRKTYTSAYNTYNSVIGLLVDFREFKEKKVGMIHKIASDDEWPYQESLLILKSQGSRKDERKCKDVLLPTFDEVITNENSEDGKYMYKTKGRRLISDFSYQLTPEKYSVLQKMALLEDTRIVYQALLAKLFINEKIELGGIMRTNLDVVEGEFQCIHKSTNIKEKFLISVDFFRRLGDIMYYKNGLVGFSFKDNANGTAEENFIDSLYYWGYDIRHEIHDYCNKFSCFEEFGNLKKMSNNILYDKEKSVYMPKAEDVANPFWKYVKNGIDDLPLDRINKCRERRKKMWEMKCSMPCYACLYYNRSLRIMASNIFNLSGDEKKAKTSKTKVILSHLIKDDFRTMRQNHMIQLAEVLECCGNTMLSCSDIIENSICEDFLRALFNDVKEMNKHLDGTKNSQKFELLKFHRRFSKLERCILYYWEASVCFRYGREYKKAAGSMKKILRVIQNYLRVSERLASNKDANAVKKDHDRKKLIGEYMEEIKKRLVKQGLINMYTHYNFINLVELQKLKWIFNIQMYENMSLNKLSLFPDVEDIMMIYYELLKLCVLPDDEIKNEQEKLKQEEILEKLSNIYNNISLGTLRHQSTIYERVMALKFKTMMNQYILDMTFPEITRIQFEETKHHQKYIECLCAYFIPQSYMKEGADVRYLNIGKMWKVFFPSIDFKEEDDNEMELQLFEFLIMDSIYCLTYILKTITPYTSTTLFTNSFMGEVYRNLNKWNVLFDFLFEFYKVFDVNKDCTNKRFCGKANNDRRDLFQDYDEKRKEKLDAKEKSIEKRQKRIAQLEGREIKDDKNNRPKFEDIVTYVENLVENMEICYNYYRNIWHCGNLSERFFERVLSTIDKPNIHYTLTNYSVEMALKSYRMAKETHREGKAYKDMISKMYYLDDDLKNDTVQFDLAIERFKINSGYIDLEIDEILKNSAKAVYDIEKFCEDNESGNLLSNRFPDVYGNIYD